MMVPLSILFCAMIEREAIVTAYSPSIAGGGAGTYLTSTGLSTREHGYGVAADPRLVPYGSVVRIPGYREEEHKGGPWHPVDDTGGAMRKSAARGVLHLDVRFRSVSSARAWGVRRLRVTIYIPEG
jgi:3D (Asp-Asp-Asp) domain-containing protein